MTDPPQGKFHSFMAPYLEKYVQIRQTLGYVLRSDIHLLRQLDDYILWKGLSRLNQIDDRFAANWMFSVSSHAAGTKNTRLVVLRSFCSYLVRLGLLKENPALKLPYLEVPPFKPYIYSLQEIAALIHQSRTWKNPPHRLFMGWLMSTLIYTLYACGLRLGEALNLKLEDIDFSENTLSLWKTKFHKERLVPFSKETRERLIQYLAVRDMRRPSFCNPDDYLFRPTRNRYYAQTIYKYFHEIRLACGFTKSHEPRLHDLRHTFAVHRLYKWYQEDKDVLNKLPLLSTYMGHVCISSTQVYLTIARGLLREGNRRFQKLSEPIPQDYLEKVLKKNAGAKS